MLHFLGALFAFLGSLLAAIVLHPIALVAGIVIGVLGHVAITRFVDRTLAKV